MLTVFGIDCRMTSGWSVTRSFGLVNGSTVPFMSLACSRPPLIYIYMSLLSWWNVLHPSGLSCPQNGACARNRASLIFAICDCDSDEIAAENGWWYPLVDMHTHNELQYFLPNNHSERGSSLWFGMCNGKSLAICGCSFWRDQGNAIDDSLLRWGELGIRQEKGTYH